MLSKEAKYGIRAVLNLAQKMGTGPVVIKDIAREEGIPQKFLEAILVKLKTGGIVRSRAGKHGGYEFHRNPREINLGQIIRILDGPLALISCVSQTAYAPCDDCPNERACLIRMVMKQVRDSTAEILESSTLAMLLETKATLDQQALPIDFNI